MRKSALFISIFILFILKNSSTFAQYTFFIPEGSFAIEVSMENTNLKRLPIYRNAITSLSILNNNIIGGTSAENNMSPFLFLASLNKREVTNILDLDQVVTGQSKIKSGFVKDAKDQLYVGTIPKELSQAGGHLLKIQITDNSELITEDLGIPVEGEGIFTIRGSNDKSKIYGLSYPSGYFFVYDIDSKKTKIYEDLALKESVSNSMYDQFSLEAKDLLSNELIVDDRGLVYGSLPFGKLFYFDPNTETLNELEQELPEVWGRRSLGQVQAWLKTKSGKLYGANHADGQLFELDPKTKGIKNIGKPIMMHGIIGLVEGADNKIYGVAGEKPGYAHLFSYDEKEGFKDYGNPEFDMITPGLEQGIRWRAFQIGSIAASDDGKYIVIGENESLSQVLVFSIN